MAVIDFLDATVFDTVYRDIPLIRTPGIEAICAELSYAVRNNEQVFVYGDYDMDGFCAVMVWREVFSLLRAKPIIPFNYVARTHNLDKDIVSQVERTDARVVIICDTGSGYADSSVLDTLQMRGYTTIVIDHHVYEGDYQAECNKRLTFNACEELPALSNCEVSGAYASLLVAKVLCEKYMDNALSFNACVYALASMYSDCIDMSSPLARVLYSVVASSNARGPELFASLNKWSYWYSRRFFTYIVAPKVNGCFRMERLDILNRAFGTLDKFHTKSVCEEFEKLHPEAKALVSGFTTMFEREKFGDIVLCTHVVTSETRSLHIRNFTGVIAAKIASEEMCAVVVVVKDSRTYAGSYRDYYNRNMLGSFKIFCHAGGHDSAFGLSFSDMSEFKRHLGYLGAQLSASYEKPYQLISSGMSDSGDDYNTLALYNEFMNRRPMVLISHTCTDVKLVRETAYNRYYQVGLPGNPTIMVSRPLARGSRVLLEPSICRGVELRESV